MHIYRENEPMKLHTSFRIGGPADIYAEPESTEELRELMDAARRNGSEYAVIGHGSNLLVGDGGFRGTIICLGKAFSEIHVAGDMLEAQAGALLGTAANAALEYGLAGMEFASGIPGSVGGAVVMNAGAYGGEMKDILESAEILEADGTVNRMTAEALELSYRSSNIAALSRIVLSGRYRLQPDSREEISARMRDFNGRRREKQPLEFPSAGSTFKRPKGFFSGKLIEDAGCKGLRSGGAQVSEKHAGFVINTGNASAADVLVLIREVQRRVRELSGVELQPEVKMLGEFL